MNSKMLIIPCSGIGKCYGSISRESSFIVAEELCREHVRLMPLSLVVLGEEDVHRQLLEFPAITIDGCKLACAAKVVSESGGTVAHGIMVLDVHRKHRELKPSGIAQLNADGQQLAEHLAAEVSEHVAAFLQETNDASAS